MTTRERGIFRKRSGAVTRSVRCLARTARANYAGAHGSCIAASRRRALNRLPRRLPGAEESGSNPFRRVTCLRSTSVSMSRGALSESSIAVPSRSRRWRSGSESCRRGSRSKRREIRAQNVVRTQLFGSRIHGPIAFIGGVEGLLIGPFLETARALGTGETNWVFEESRGFSGPRALGRSGSAGHAVVPFCAIAAEAALRFATVSTTVSTTIRRADLGALPPGVHALPTVLADGAIVAEGAMDEALLLRQITSYQRSLPARSGVTCVAPSERGQPEPSQRPRSAPKAPRATRRPPRSTAA